MPEHLIHRNAETVINQLKILNETLGNVAGSKNKQGSLQDIAQVLREIRDVIKSPDPGGGSNGSDCDVETSALLDEATKGSNGLHMIFAEANLASLRAIAGNSRQKAKARAREILDVLGPLADKYKVDLPLEGQLIKAVKCAREKTYGRQDSPNNTATAAS